MQPPTVEAQLPSSGKDPVSKAKQQEYPPGVVISPRTGKPKRRKANRACVHCQRTHLTCDNNRPCERCVQRGLADTCRDGTRKKAKYLQDVPDSLTPTASSSAAARRKSSGASVKKESTTSSASPQDTFRHPSTISDTALAQPSYYTTNAPPSPAPPHHHPHDRRNSSMSSISSAGSIATTLSTNGGGVPAAVQTLGGGGDINNNGNGRHHSHHNHHHHFQSTAINSEYRILSNILHGTAATTGGVSLQDVQNTGQSPAPSESSDSPNSSFGGTVYQSSVLNHFTLGGTPDEKTLIDVLSSVDDNAYSSMNSNNNDWMTTAGDSPKPKRPISFAITDYDPQPVERVPNRMGVLADIAPTTSNSEDWRTLKEPGDIYSKIRKPYSYTPAYHALIAYLRSRFDREQLMKMAKHMASYRPSFIACTNTLEEDDLIFMEQCFQRTLLEYEKFISYSGTPTIIWRRTGQITAVGKEFCILTGWSKQRLLGQRTFIIELMDDDSALEYFQMFSDIAFGDSRATMMAECTLLTPNGQRLKTSSMWTLKRDVFGIPMMVVGNFLPILS